VVLTYRGRACLSHHTTYVPMHAPDNSSARREEIPRQVASIKVQVSMCLGIGCLLFGSETECDRLQECNIRSSRVHKECRNAIRHSSIHRSSGYYMPTYVYLVLT
jgi:hypothetical protein